MDARLRRAGAIGVAVLMVAVAIVGALALTGRLDGGPRCATLVTGTCTRVLFIGNSYTYVNDLPSMFAELARAAGYEVETGEQASGGATLADQVAASTTTALIASRRWDFVVLQEQSEIPAVERLRSPHMDPAARTLVRAVKAIDATPLFLVTWAHRDGWPENGMADYDRMQEQIDVGYGTISHELGVPEAPVGQAWASVRLSDPSLALWQADGSHPSTAGTYLAACVLVAAVFRVSSEGSTFSAGLSTADARLLQTAAARTVLDAPSRWGLR